MKITKLNYSAKPWRLLNDEGGQICTTIRDGSGKVIATNHPVCFNTKSEAVEWVLGRLEWYIRHARVGLLPPMYDPD